MMSARPNGGMNRCARCLNSLDIISNTSLVMSEYLKKLHTLLTLFKKHFSLNVFSGFYVLHIYAKYLSCGRNLSTSWLKDPPLPLGNFDPLQTVLTSWCSHFNYL